MMLDLNEVYMDSAGTWRLRKVSINPSQVVAIKENPRYAKLVSEGNSNVPSSLNSFCTVLLQMQEMVVVGEINELRHAIKNFKKKGLIHG